MNLKFAVHCSSLQLPRFSDKEFDTRNIIADFEEAENYFFKVINLAILMRKLIVDQPRKLMLQEQILPTNNGLKEIFKHKIYNRSSLDKQECIKFVYILNGKSYSIIEIRNLDFYDIQKLVKNNKKLRFLSMKNRAEQLNIFHQPNMSFFDLHFDFENHYHFNLEKIELQKLYHQKLGILSVHSAIQCFDGNNMTNLLKHLVATCNTKFANGTCLVKIKTKNEAFALKHFLLKTMNIGVDSEYIHLIEDHQSLYFWLIKPQSFKLQLLPENGVLLLNFDNVIKRIMMDSAVSDLPFYSAMADLYEHTIGDEFNNIISKHLHPHQFLPI